MFKYLRLFYFTFKYLDFISFYSSSLEPGLQQHAAICWHHTVLHLTPPSDQITTKESNRVAYSPGDAREVAQHVLDLLLFQLAEGWELWEDDDGAALLPTASCGGQEKYQSDIQDQPAAEADFYLDGKYWLGLFCVI